MSELKAPSRGTEGPPLTTEPPDESTALTADQRVGALSDAAGITPDPPQEDRYDLVMADAITRLIAVCHDMPKLMHPACPYGSTFELEQAYRAVCLAIVVLDDCCTGTWAVPRHERRTPDRREPAVMTLGICAAFKPD